MTVPLRRSSARYDGEGLQCDFLTPLILRQLRDTYIKLLMAIPQVGEKKARSLVSHYPTPKALSAALMDDALSLEERQLLLQDKFDHKMKFPKLARVVYTVWTSTDPHEKLDPNS